MARLKRWTKKAEQNLLQGIGTYGLIWFMRNSGRACEWSNADTGRSRKAVYHKTRRIAGRGGLTRGAYSLRQIMHLTGYSSTQIRRAMRALDQKWKRLTPKGKYLIYEDQYLDIAQWLGTDYWAKRHRLYNCLWCNTTMFEHKGKGLCLRCYRKYIKQLERKGLPVNNKDLIFTVKKQVDGDVQKIVKQLKRNRALPQSVVRQLSGELCFF